MNFYRILLKTKSLDAIATTRKRCWRYDYVIELDVKGLFDNIDHWLLMKVVEGHVIKKNYNQNMKRYCKICKCMITLSITHW